MSTVNAWSVKPYQRLNSAFELLHRTTPHPRTKLSFEGQTMFYRHAIQGGTANALSD